MRSGVLFDLRFRDHQDRLAATLNATGYTPTRVQKGVKRQVGLSSFRDGDKEVSAIAFGQQEDKSREGSLGQEVHHIGNLKLKYTV